LDVDDAIYLKEPKWVGHVRPTSKAKEDKFNYVVSKCCLIIAGNDSLKKRTNQLSDKVIVIPTGIDDNNHIKDSSTTTGTCIVTWIGLPSNLRYLDMLHTTFATLTERHPEFLLRIICSDFPQWNDVRLEKIKWSGTTEKQMLADSDIGIMPLDNSEYSMGKCAFKLLQYMAARLPCIASPVGANCDVIIHNVNGYLASNEDEWLEKLSFLIKNPDVREKMGQKGLEKSTTDYHQDDIAKKYADVVISTL
jgi:glycosyltransferase involved in cell wall biosynthesis